MTYKTALVTGGAGFIGSHIVDALVARRVKVFVVDDLSTGHKENLNPNVSFTKLSVTSPAFRTLVKKVKPDVIFHLAAHLSVRASIERPIHDATVNILGTLNMLEAAREAGVKKIVVTSSGGIMYPASLKRASEEDGIYPESPYGVSKRAIELYLEHYWSVFKIPYVALRLSNVYGPRQRAHTPGEGGVVPNFIETMRAGKRPFITGKGDKTRDFVYVTDVAAAALAAARSSYVGIVNISSCQEASVHQIFDLLARLVKYPHKPEYRQAIAGEKQRSCMNNKRARQELGWTPKVGLREGLAQCVRFFDTRKLQKKSA
ncbi:NAD-dependent epimerase/dehydratase family protein [Candidatus Uhrbacteria bacterium]|nr:NAD-dependent epimerase/dehydratase family protein [Candidatus Uhrbacteria bacterium]